MTTDRQEEFPEAADFLCRTFLVETIPDFVFKQPNITNKEQENETEISHKLS
ncbi:32015_t:CDS:2 [Gigaspora margarita]|uniref:32015_t:CDS:1 n=1 Tax=Gigaspora margarita TaxID=4874 RepID=A0ABN7UF02_GIGMA|nr:32015_t:CDS:2 [Gigaspora margarita]